MIGAADGQVLVVPDLVGNCGRLDVVVPDLVGADACGTDIRLRLTNRARLAISYGIVIAMVLVVVAVALSAVHERLGIARIDADLRAAMQSLGGVVASEINERLTLEVGAREALVELELPGLGRWCLTPPAVRR